VRATSSEVITFPLLKTNESLFPATSAKLSLKRERTHQRAARCQCKIYEGARLDEQGDNILGCRGARADDGGGDLGAAQLLRQSFGEAGDVRLGGEVDRHAGTYMQTAAHAHALDVSVDQWDEASTGRVHVCAYLE
jgi:hypothetical protein